MLLSLSSMSIIIMLPSGFFHPAGRKFVMPGYMKPSKRKSREKQLLLGGATLAAAAAVAVILSRQKKSLPEPDAVPQEQALASTLMSTCVPRAVVDATQALLTGQWYIKLNLDQTKMKRVLDYLQHVDFASFDSNALASALVEWTSQTSLLASIPSLPRLKMMVRLCGEFVFSYSILPILLYWLQQVVDTLIYFKFEDQCWVFPVLILEFYQEVFVPATKLVGQTARLLVTTAEGSFWVNYEQMTLAQKLEAGTRVLIHVFMLQRYYTDVPRIVFDANSAVKNVDFENMAQALSKMQDTSQPEHLRLAEGSSFLKATAAASMASISAFLAVVNHRMASYGRSLT